ncbi:hypothetical protein GIB67_000594 [Kingdonia uniflora]|uniref:dihydropyrimidinase n=1 Tax=Kingdonia uniflora TaxID=39325 RepID=A0A7J7P7H4_9MAGN|nr:hypothetical protein GIB67_000594 [Kingdonia uniflora]
MAEQRFKTLYFISLLLLCALSFRISKSNQTPEFCYEGESAGCRSPTTSKILIKGGIVVNAHHQEVADVYVEDGIIVLVQSKIKVGDDVIVIDATGKYVMPGGIDPHTHLGMEFMGSETIDDFFSGQAAALAGGTTMHIDFALPINGSLSAGFEAYTKKARMACMDYGFHMAVTKWNEVVSRDMEILVKEKGINSFKFFLAYKGSFMINDELLLEGFKKCKTLGAVPMVHAENGDAVAEGQKRIFDLGITGPEGHGLSRPPMLEGEATSRAIRLASFVNVPLYVVHVMSIDAMEEIAKAQKSGQAVVGEAVVSGLVLDDSALWDPDFTTAAKQGSVHFSLLSFFLSYLVLSFDNQPRLLLFQESLAKVSICASNLCMNFCLRRTMSDPRFAFYVRVILEVTRLEAGVVTEDSKKFVGDGLEMKHLEETTEREVHRAIDLVGEKDGGMSKSSRSKDNEEVVTLMQRDVSFGTVLEQFETIGVVENNASVTRMCVGFRVEPENGNPNIGLPHIARTVIGEIAVPKTQHQISKVIDSYVGSSRSDNRGEEWPYKVTTKAKLLTITGNESEVIGQTPSNEVVQPRTRVVRVGFQGLGTPKNNYSTMEWPQDELEFIGEGVTPHVQLVGTDHCTFNSTQKALGIDDFRKIPNGVNGIEERMHLIWDTMVESGQISATDYVRVTSTECARVFNIYPRKGAILAGSDADIIILNPNASFEILSNSHHSRSDINVYEGRKGKGKVEVTIVGGKVVWENGELKVEPGSGRYIEMPPFGHLFSGIGKADAAYLSSLRAPVHRVRSAT